MDRTSLIGVVLGIIAVGIGMVLKGVSPISLLNPAALLIIFAGTAAAILIAFPMNEIKKIPALFKILFKEQKLIDMKDLVTIFIEWATIARKEGLLALEPRAEEVDDPFLQQGIKMIVDGQPPEFIKDVLMKDLETMEERHASNATIFTQAGTYAPTLGVLGAVVGLVAALSNMADITALGHAISAAFIATLFGIFSGYVLWHPFANKLKRKSKKEVMVKEIMIEGLLSIQDGTSPKILEEKLLTYIPTSERDQYKAGGSVG
ncbi:flagellar motor stator protein MotA [Fictibacillus barbaricus]|jgi:chemotaxis protein MotA|uniref:Flagellar motor stator protein MotA n=1 Tax=Fictibacillus barbaricus TaxID=182136 RepID=A0ABS2ZD84_9BACL|nr:flagellar motor stator protein MotA [Fictibacillus barbaricus]MBN3544609.1 flagellar motor stator protein MotA [Fictibacillus barbaricus]GGB65352.1 motility protein A [Fictibacillus barbaricus]